MENVEYAIQNKVGLMNELYEKMNDKKLPTVKREEAEKLFKELEEITWEIGDAEMCYRIAKDVKGVNVSLLEDAVIDAEDPWYCMLFAVNVKGASFKKLKNAYNHLTNKNNEYSEKDAFNLVNATDVEQNGNKEMK